MISIALMILVLAVASTESQGISWGNEHRGVECKRSGPWAGNVYTFEPSRRCDGWPRTSLETCKRYCQNNQLPNGCAPSRRNVCTYVIWDDNRGWWPGFCQLATKCTKQGKGSSVVVKINRDINECLSNNGGCNQICINKPGTYECRCRSGYTLSSNRNTCIDVNECNSNNGGCSQTCANIAGSFACGCKNGYQLGSDKKTCSDINECDSNNGGCTQICVNKAGSFACGCQNGYQLGSDKKTCADINECDSNNGGCSQTCVNKAGSFSCGCQNGYQLGSDKKTCSVLITEVTSGFCTSLTREECREIAEKRGMKLLPIINNRRTFPTGCYHKQTNDVVYYNARDKEQPCTTIRICICRKSEMILLLTR